MRSPARQSGIIYLVVNVTNGKLYVGKTGRDLGLRIREHEYDARNKGKTAFSRAIRKYGIESFEFTILETCPIERIDERERHWIAAHNCRKPHGYNLTDGGDGTLGVERPDVSKRLSSMTGERNPMYGRKFTPEERKKFGRPGERNARYGVRLSEESRKRISARTREAMFRPEIRSRFLEAIAKRSASQESQKAETRLRNERAYRLTSIERKLATCVKRSEMKKWSALYKAGEHERRSIILSEIGQRAEVRAARSANARGRRQSAESKHKMSESMKRAWLAKRAVIA